jgi:hypothetical protein
VSSGVADRPVGSISISIDGKPPISIGVVESFRLRTAEDILIEETERKMLGVETHEITTERLQTMQSLHSHGAISTATLLEHFGLSPERPEDK